MKTTIDYSTQGQDYTFTCEQGHKTCIFLTTDETESHGFEMVCQICAAQGDLEPSPLSQYELEAAGYELVR